MKLFNSNKSITKKISLLMAVGVLSFLSIGLIIFLLYSENTKLKVANDSIHELNQSMKESIIFSMSQGITDVAPYVERMRSIKGIKELRIIPTEIVNEEKAKKIDKAELKAVNSKEEIIEEEKYNNSPVLRFISLIKAEESCVDCHGGKEGDIFAVMSIRHSLEETRTAIASERISGIIVITLLVAFIWFFAVLLLKKNILNDFFKFNDAIKQFSLGNLSTKINCKRIDELGQFAESLNTLRQNLVSQADTVREFAKGNFDAKVIVLSENDQLGKSVQEIKDSLIKLSDDTTVLSVSAELGELSKRADASRHNGIFKKIISGFNATFDYLTAPIKEGSEVLSMYALGNLTGKVSGDYQGEHQQLKNDINKLGDSLSNLIGQIAEAIQATASAANQISIKYGRNGSRCTGTKFTGNRSSWCS